MTYKIGLLIYKDKFYDTCISIVPFSVNFSELLIKFRRIYLIRFGSENMRPDETEKWLLTYIPFFSAYNDISSIISFLLKKKNLK